jgi:voltage-gated potassium channel
MTDSREREELDRERGELLHRVEKWIEMPMVMLGFVWLALLVLELTRGLNPALETAGTAIWIVFILDFALRFALAPRKVNYLQSNWLTAISLVLPALRVFRIVRLVQVLRAARATRGLRLLKLFGSLNRGMRALGRTMGRRGVGYVAALTMLITLAGAAGMHYFERGQGLDDFGTALWWTAMIMTTMGSEYWPKTAEGRVLCVMLALYAFAVFGYVTATIATFFLGRDAENPEAELAGTTSMEALRNEIAALREEIRALSPQQRPG